MAAESQVQQLSTVVCSTRTYQQKHAKTLPGTAVELTRRGLLEGSKSTFHQLLSGILLMAMPLRP